MTSPITTLFDLSNIVITVGVKIAGQHERARMDELERTLIHTKAQPVLDCRSWIDVLREFRAALNARPSFIIVRVFEC